MKKISESKREFELEVPAEKVKKEMDRILTQFSSTAKVKGFRPGKAPRSIVKQMYYPEIKDSLINSLVPKALKEELEKHSIDPLGSPVINSISYEEGGGIRFKAQIEVWPDFSLPDYKNIKVQKKKTSITEKEINTSLNQLQERSAQYIPVEGRGVMNGDYVIAEFKGQDLKTKKHLPTERSVILAGHPDNDSVLNESIKEMKQDEERDFTIKYKKDHPNKKLAGKDIKYALRVISIKEKKLPEINDDFAKDLGEFNDLKDLKMKIKEELLGSKKTIRKREIAEEIIQKTSDKVAVELPEGLVEQEYIAVLKRLLSTQGRKDMSEGDLNSLKENAKKKAQQNVKSHLILKKIAEKEDIKVSEEDISEELKAVAEARKIPLSTVMGNLDREGGREEIRENILLKKTIDFLAECAIME